MNSTNYVTFTKCNRWRARRDDEAVGIDAVGGVEAQFWLNLQTQFDLTVAEKTSGEAIKSLPSATARA